MSPSRTGQHATCRHAGRGRPGPVYIDEVSTICVRKYLAFLLSPRRVCATKERGREKKTGRYPVELKPDTGSGLKAGTRQLRRYLKTMNKDYGGVCLWKMDAAGNYSFRLGVVPKPGTKRQWLKF
nr:hypothetical protein [Actinoplanes missouriensis]